jgi:hypothetical protein
VSASTTNSDETSDAGVFDEAVAAAESRPRTHLVWSTIAAALFFLPLGLVAVVFSWRCAVWNRRGDLARARRNSRWALAMVIVTVVVGIGVYVALIGALLALGAFGGGQ